VTRHIPIDEAGSLVSDVMMSSPHTNAATESVADARAALTKSSVKLLVVVDGDRFAGTIARDDLPDGTDGTAPLTTIARTDGPRLDPADSVAKALEVVRANDAERVPVVDAQGVLRGLVCLNRGSDRFCA
jgi:CBS-domain-containing membrane protein